jgi:chromate transporter
VNATNLIVYIGQHLRGAAGAATALVAMLTGPFVVVLLAAVAYQQLLQVPGFQAAMAGVAAAAIGMLVRLAAMSVKSAVTGVFPVLVMLGIVFAIAVMRWPMVPVVLVAAPLSIALCWPRRKRPHA